MKPNIFLFDVEATSLHGIGFAMGAIVANAKTGEIIDKFELLSEEGAKQANDWVKQNVLPHLKDMPTCQTNAQLRQQFYLFYAMHRATSEVWSDVNFPVETNFLADVARDNLNMREFEMPYPLKDVSTLVDVNINRNEASGILNLRKHHPVDDAIASLTVLLEKLNQLKTA